MTILKKTPRYIACGLLTAGLVACGGDDNHHTPSDPPVVNAGASFNVLEGDSQRLSPTVTPDLNRTITTYSWTQVSGPQVNIDHPDEQYPLIFAPDVDQDTDVVFRLQVTDDQEHVVSDDITFSLIDDPIRPIAQPVVHSFVAEGTGTQLRGRGSVYAGEPGVTGYRWTQVGGTDVVLVNDESRILSFTAPRVIADQDLEFEFVVDNGIDSIPLLYTVTVTNIPIAPSAKAGDDLVRVEGTTVELVGDGDIVINEPAITGYSWTQPAGQGVELQNADTQTLTFVAPEVSEDTDFVFYLRTNNGLSSDDVDSVTVTVTNTIPTAVATGPITVTEGDAFVIDGSTSLTNGGRDLTSYTWRSESEGFVVGNDDLASATRTIVARGVTDETDYRFGLIVGDGQDASTEDFVTIRVINSTDFPVAIAVNDNVEVPQGTAGELDAAPSTEPQNRALTFSWTQVLAVGEQAVEFTTAGSKLNFTAPTVDEDTVLTFNVVANNGFNSSVPEEVLVTVLSEVTYNGDFVQLKGNPFTTLFDSLITDHELFDIEVVGDLAYVTYNENDVDSDAPQPTGLLVIDISDEKDLKVLQDYPITWYGNTNSNQVQMKLAIHEVEGVAQYAYIAERQLRNDDDALEADSLGLVRIDLTSEPDPTDNGELYHLVDPADNYDPTVSDVVIRNGRIYASFYGETQKLVSITIASDPAAPVITDLWTAESSSQDSMVSAGLDVNSDGSVAVIFDDDNIQVIRFDDEGVLESSFQTEPTAFPNDSYTEGKRSVAIDDNGEYAYVSFAADPGVADPDHFYSTVERVDILVDELTGELELPVRFLVNEYAQGLRFESGLAYLASGDQGLQLIENTDAGLSLNTYYQTPASAVEIALNTSRNRAYVIGESTFSVIDLSGQATPAITADNEVEKYYESETRPGRAEAVEIVQVPEVGEFAIVAEGSNPDNISNNIKIFPLGSEVLVGSEIDISGYHDSSLPRLGGIIRLQTHNGDVYVEFPLNDQTEDILVLRNDQLMADEPAVESFMSFSNGRGTGLGFSSNSSGVVVNYGYIIDWVLDESGVPVFEDSDTRITNEFPRFSFVTEDQRRIVGIGTGQNSFEGCKVFDAAGTSSRGSKIGFEVPTGKVFSGTYDDNADVCYAGFGYSPALRDSEMREYSEGFGILSVDFKVSPENIDTDSETAEDKWEDLLNKDDIANTSTYLLPDNPEDIVSKGDRLYVANNVFGGVQILDASNPVSMTLEGVIHTQDKALGVAINSNETFAVIADEDFGGVSRIVLDYPVLNRTDNDGDFDEDSTPEEIAFADVHAFAGDIITYVISWNRSEYDQIACFATTDTDDFGNDTCLATAVEGSPSTYTITWQLPEEVADQEIRIAVGNNIEFLSVNARVFVSEAIEEVPVSSPEPSPEPLPSPE